MHIDWIIRNSPQDYSQVIKELEEKVELIHQKKANDCVLLLEHDEVFTYGMSFANSDEILDKKIPITKSNRGGKLTYHGPGQRIIYPIINLDNIHYKKNIRNYIYLIQKWISNTIFAMGIKNYLKKGEIGIWTHNKNNEEAKIVSLGFRVRKWVIYHGAAINISVDLKKFNKIVPCGVHDTKITSLCEINKFIKNEEFDKILIKEFHKIFRFYDICK